VFAALVVGGRAEAAAGLGFAVDAVDVAIEAEVEVEAGLFAVGDDIEAGAGLVMEGGDDGVVLEFGEVVGSKFGKVGGGEFEPGRERVGADDGGAKGDGLHGGRVSEGSIRRRCRGPGR
jgi:hypothetical protein